MAVVKCPVVADTYTKIQIDTSTAKTTENNNNFGTLETYLYGEETIGDLYIRNYGILMFDISSVLGSRAKSVKLYQYRHSANPINATSRFLTLNEEPFFLEISLTYSNRSSKTQTVGSSLTIADNQSAGWVVYDLTSIFDINYRTGNYIGIYLLAVPISGLYGVVSQDSREGIYPPYLEVETEPIIASAPTNLFPDITQNPRGAITFNWLHSGITEFSDPQIGWKLTYWQDGVTPAIETQNNTSNTYTLPANTFTQYKTVYFTVNTITQYGGLSQTAYGQFGLGATPPLQSTLIYPIGISVNGMNGVGLEWAYNSPHDTQASRFDIRHREDSAAWVESYNQGQTSYLTPPILTQSKVEWQVRAYGALGDMGEWSEIGTFYTIGVPDTPIIVEITNQGRPLVTFSAQNFQSWELEITQNGNVIYRTGSMPFLNNFSHRLMQFIDDGQYLSRMRVTNKDGFVSEWGERAFTINMVKPQALKLEIVDNSQYNLRLYFNNTGKTVFVYRSELRQNNYLRIAKVTSKVFDDWTAAPNTRYEYFVRVVDANYNFADSNLDSGMIRFVETIIAPSNDLSNGLMLKWQYSGQPGKNMTFGKEKKLSQFVGRRFKVYESGIFENATIDFSFALTQTEIAKLKALTLSEHVLCLRDSRYGAVFGIVDGDPNGSNLLQNEYSVGFSFTQTDFKQEVDLD